MNEVKRILNIKTVYVMIISMVLCFTYFVVKCIGFDGVTEFIRHNREYAEGIKNVVIYDAVDDKSTEIKEYVNYINSYRDSIDDILSKANIINNYDVFTEDKYLRRNLEKTYKDYNRLLNVEPVITNTRGFDSYVNFIPSISAFVLIIVIYCLFSIRNEYDNREILFTYSSKNGRLRLSLKRGLILTAITIILTLIFNTLILLVSEIMYGWGDFTVPIQSSVLFSDCTYTFSFGEYFFVNVIETGIGLSFIILFTSLFFNVLKNKYVSLLLIGILFLSEWRLSLLEQNNTVNRLLANINIYKIVDFSSYYRNYQNLNIFGIPVSSDIAIIVLVCCLYLVNYFLSSFSYSIRYPFSKTRFGKVKSYFEITFAKIYSKFGFCGFELYKIFLRRKRILFLLAILVVEIVLINITVVVFPERQREVDNIYVEYGGEDFERFELYVQEYKCDIDNKNNEIAKLKQSGNSDKSLQSGMREISRLSAEVAEMEKIYAELENVVSYKENIQDMAGVKVYAMSDRGYNEVFGGNSTVREIGIMIIMITLIVLLGSGFYLEEKQSGVYKIVNTSRMGVRKVFEKKLWLIFCSVGVIALMIIAMDYIGLYRIYDFRFLDAPLLSLTFMADKVKIFLDMKIWQYIMIDIVMKMLMAEFTLIVTLMLSLKSKSLFFVPIVVFIASLIGVIVLLSALITKLIIMCLMAIVLVFLITYIIRGGYGIKN